MADTLSQALLEASLLASLPEEDEGSVIIDVDKRSMVLPTGFFFGVYNDKDILKVPFVIPRYYNELDLSEFQITVNYINSAGYGNVYRVTNAEVTDSTIRFKWVTGRGVFVKEGTVRFIVCLRQIGTGGEVEKEFNTTIASANVLKGLEVDENPDPVAYSILAHMEELEDQAEAAVEVAEGAAERIDDAVTEAEQAIAAMYHSPYIAPTAADMLSHDKVYVYTGNETGYTFGNWYYWNGSAFVSGGVYNATAFETDDTLSISGAAADAKKTGDEISGLKEDLDDFEDGYEPSVIVHKNLLDVNEPTSITQYYRVNASGHLALDTASTATYNSYIIATKANQIYSTNKAIRFVIPLDSEQEPLVATAIDNVTSIDTTDYPGTAYLAISIRNNDPSFVISEVAFSEGSTPSQEVVTEPPVLPGWTNAITDRLDVLEPAASASAVGKFLKVKTIADGKVTEYEFGEGGGSGVTVDDALSTESTNPAQNKAITAGINYVRDGMGDGIQIHRNLLDVNEPTSITQYYWINSSVQLVLSTAPTATYNSYIIAVKSNQVYSCNKLIRYAAPLDSNKAPLVSSVLSNVSSIDTTDYPGTAYLAISIRNDNIDFSEVAFSEGDTPSQEVISIVQELPTWCQEKFDEVDEKINSYDLKPKKNKIFMLTDTAFAAEKSFSDFATSAKSIKMNLVVNMSSFTSVTVGLKTTDHVAFYAEITDTAVNLYDYGTGGNTVYTKTYNHNLTIAENLSIDIYPNDNTSNYYVKIASGGAEYTTPSPFTVSHVGMCYPYASMVGAATFVQFSAIADTTRPIWVFGDSYLGTNNTKRWAYYLVTQEHATRAMLDGYAGENSATALTSLQTLIQCGTPDYLVWCLGMNDGSDSGTTPKAAWLEKVQSVIEICEANNIKLILATVPTVPSINNEGKNKWVRESGYQYIDFARAVGASSQGVWFTGMLDTDNVHPTALGAITLYHGALAGCPQFNQK